MGGDEGAGGESGGEATVDLKSGVELCLFWVFKGRLEKVKGRERSNA